MINIMLVAGRSTSSLASFLEQRGTFKVDFIYSDLYSNADELIRQIIKVDKFVYLYILGSDEESPDMNVRMDMQTLSSLLRTGGFFKADELLFLCGEGDKYSQAKRYFSTVMKDNHVSQYEIRTIDNQASFSSIYNNLIGTSVVRDFKNSYIPLYRRERGSDSTLVYEGGDDFDLSIEPFSYTNLKNWEEQKKLAVSIDKDNNIIEADDIDRQKFLNLNLGSVETNDVFEEGTAILVTGGKRSGKSLWAATLAASAISEDKHVAVYDCTSNPEIYSIMKRDGVNINEVSVLEMIQTQKSEGSAIVIAKPGEALLDLFRYIVRQGFKYYDCVIVVIEPVFWEGAYAVLQTLVSHVFATCFAENRDVENLWELLGGCKPHLVIAMNEGSMTAEDIKLKFQDANVIKPFHIDNCTQLNNLYSAVVSR